VIWNNNQKPEGSKSYLKKRSIVECVMGNSQLLTQMKIDYFRSSIALLVTARSSSKTIDIEGNMGSPRLE
jgi:hypothetical protein